MAYDDHVNFGYSTVAVAPAPAISGTALSVASGQGALFPVPPFNCVIFPIDAPPLSSNAEIVRVTGIAGDVFTIIRTQEATAARAILVGDQIANAITKKVITDIENAVPKVLNPDNGLYYYWQPQNGDIDPATGLPTIVGVWVPV